MFYSHRLFRLFPVAMALFIGTSFSYADETALPVSDSLQAKHLTENSAPDSAVAKAPSDSAVTIPDSTVVKAPSDSAVTIPDSAVAKAPSDSAVTIPDSAVAKAPSDSAATIPDSAVAKAQTDSSNADTILYQKRRPMGLGLIYEITNVKASNVESNMRRKGKNYDVDVDISNLIGIASQYYINKWISLFGAFAYNRFDIDYTPRDKSDKERSITANNLLLQGGFQIGFSFLHSQNYQIRALGFLGGMFGYSFLNDDYYMNPLIFGYLRGIGLQVAIHRVAIFAGVRSTHYYFHTYDSSHWDNDDYGFMLDFDTMSCPFFSVGIGF